MIDVRKIIVASRKQMAFGDTNDVSGSSTVFAPSMPAGWSIPDNPADWYSYPLTFANLLVATTEFTLPGAPQTQQIQIDAAADFYWTALTMTAQVHGNNTALTYGTVVVPLATILVNDGGSNRNLMQNPVPLPSVAGDARWPHRLQHPRLFKKNSTVAVTLVNLDANNAYDILLNFEGFKLYGN